MQLTEVKNVQIGELTLPVIYSTRCYMEYKAMTGEDLPSFKTTELQAQWFYCMAKAGARSEAKRTGTPFSFHTFDEFLDLIDDHYPEWVINFSKALVKPGGDEKK